MNWNDITLKKYYQIQQLLETPDEYTVINIINCVYDTDIETLPITKLKEYDISFLNNEFEKPEIQKTYTLNGTEYKSNFDLSRISVAQFIDYQNYTKEKPIKFEDVLSVFFLPTSAKEYNTDYDINKVKEDLLELPIPVASSLGFFLTKQLEMFRILFHCYFTVQIQEMKIPKHQKKAILDNLDKMESLNSELFHICLNTAK